MAFRASPCRRVRIRLDLALAGVRSAAQGCLSGHPQSPTGRCGIGSPVVGVRRPKRSSARPAAAAPDAVGGCAFKAASYWTGRSRSGNAHPCRHGNGTNPLHTHPPPLGWFCRVCSAQGEAKEPGRRFACSRWRCSLQPRRVRIRVWRSNRSRIAVHVATAMGRAVRPPGAVSRSPPATPYGPVGSGPARGTPVGLVADVPIQGRTPVHRRRRLDQRRAWRQP